MEHIIQPRGAGTAYRFKMRTPKSLQGLTDPKTEKPFKKWLTRSLGGTSHLPTAKKMRDIRLAEIRAMEAQVSAGASLDSRFSLERAEGWAEALRAQNAKGGPDDYQPNIYDLIEDEVSAAPKAQPKAFKKVALSGTISLADAVERYLHDRREGNGSGYAPLKDTTKNDLRKALWYLCQFMEETEDTLFIDDVSVEQVEKFRGDFLPDQKSPRAPNGLSLATIEKLCGLLRNLWVWAIERRHLPEGHNPFVQAKGVRRQKPSKERKRDMYSADEANAVMLAFPVGHRLGDIFRLTLFTGCRADEIAKVKAADVEADGSFFSIAGGKSKNAKRLIPVPELARGILKERVKKAVEASEDRIFFDFPLRPSTGKASSLSQLFTRERRKVLGGETDGRLTFHSLRHTWFTKARQAGVPTEDRNDLGGWAGPRASSDAYDHGLLLEDLTKRQEQVAERLRVDGYLDAF